MKVKMSKVWDVGTDFRLPAHHRHAGRGSFCRKSCEYHFSPPRLNVNISEAVGSCAVMQIRQAGISRVGNGEMFYS